MRKALAMKNSSRVGVAPAKSQQRDRPRQLRGAVTQRTKQCRSAFERQRLSANRWLHTTFGHGGAQQILVIARLKIVPERLAFLSKAKFQEIYVLSLRDSKRLQPRLDGDPNDARVHFWRRSERRWREGEKHFPPAVKLRGGWNQAIVGAA